MHNTNSRQDREISTAQQVDANSAIKDLVSIIEELDTSLTEANEKWQAAEQENNALKDRIADLEKQVANSL